MVPMSTPVLPPPPRGQYTSIAEGSRTSPAVSLLAASSRDPAAVDEGERENGEQPERGEQQGKLHGAARLPRADQQKEREDDDHEARVGVQRGPVMQVDGREQHQCQRGSGVYGVCSG